MLMANSVILFRNDTRERRGVLYADSGPETALATRIPAQLSWMHSKPVRTSRSGKEPCGGDPKKYK